jgi:hypothetical protein
VGGGLLHGKKTTELIVFSLLVYFCRFHEENKTQSSSAIGADITHFCSPYKFHGGKETNASHTSQHMMVQSV